MPVVVVVVVSGLLRGAVQVLKREREGVLNNLEQTGYQPTKPNQIGTQKPPKRKKHNPDRKKPRPGASSRVTAQHARTRPTTHRSRHRRSPAPAPEGLEGTQTPNLHRDEGGLRLEAPEDLLEESRWRFVQPGGRPGRGVDRSWLLC